ncbi:MAG: hypothetical protein ACWA5T_07475 [Parvularcula sp.]
MIKIVAILYVLLGPVLAGMGLMIVLFIPALQQDEMRMIIVGSVIGAVLAIPLSIWVAKKIYTVPGLMKG